LGLVVSPCRPDLTADADDAGDGINLLDHDRRTVEERLDAAAVGRRVFVPDARADRVHHGQRREGGHPEHQGLEDQPSADAGHDGGHERGAGHQSGGERQRGHFHHAEGRRDDEPP
jgi:hypothetical protein